MVASLIHRDIDYTAAELDRHQPGDGR